MPAQTHDIKGATFEGLQMANDFVTMEMPQRPDTGPLLIVWLLYGIGNDSQLDERHYENCRVNTTGSWR